MPKDITADSRAASAVHVVIVALDNHLASAVDRAARTLSADVPGLEVSFFAATDWNADPEALNRARDAIETGDIVICQMLFMEEHIKAVEPWLKARQPHCDAMIGTMSGGEVMRLTRMGQFKMDGSGGGPLKLLKKLHGKKKDPSAKGGAGARHMAMLKRIPKILRFVPGTAQDVRAYFLTLQYLLAGSDDNVANMIRFLIDRYADGERRALRGHLKATPPADYPEVGIYHPKLKNRIAERIEKLPVPKNAGRGTVGVLVMRSYVLAGNTRHYDAVIEALEARGLRVIPCFAWGLDARPAVEKYFMKDGAPVIDALLSLTGFSLVGGPAYNDSKAAEAMLKALDVPCVAAHAVEFQTLDQWRESDQGLLPIESTMMVAIPELDGSTNPMLFGGRTLSACNEAVRDMQPAPERIDMLSRRIDKLIALRQSACEERRIGIVLFNFPPNAGNTGTAAYLSVFASLFHLLGRLKAEGYAVDMPESVDALRDAIVNGNAGLHGTHANVLAKMSVDDYMRAETHLADIEAHWGAAPGKQQTDGQSLFILGARFGNVTIGIQPAFGHEGDPMRLLFEKGFAPTHAFCAFYRHLQSEFGAHAVLHFGTHGALEFMPGKQTGLSGDCWPDRLIDDLPNLYFYAANNPSEGSIAKRRAAATLISYMSPPVAQAGLYKGLLDLKNALQRWRQLAEGDRERADLAELIQAQAAGLDLCPAEPAWTDAGRNDVPRLVIAVQELEETLIPYGLHVLGAPPCREERIDMLTALADSAYQTALDRAVIAALVDGKTPADALRANKIRPELAMTELLDKLARTDRLLCEDHETPAILRGLAGRYIAPTPGGDLLRMPDVLPTGRNIHGFDPFRIPSAFAVKDGAKMAEKILATHSAAGHPLPESIALVLWGTDNLKTEGAAIGQALALIGATPRFDAYGRLCGADLIPLETLGRPRIDVVMTMSGIFRDLLPLQTKLLAEAAWLAANADEPVEQNFVRKHALDYRECHGCDMETAALRVFSNAEGAYGSNVNHMIDGSAWDDEDELGETFTRRKGFAYGRAGKPVQKAELLKNMLGGVSFAYQNLDSVELGITAIDHYYDTLGAIDRVAKAGSERDVPVYIGDQTKGEGTVRTLADQVALETRTRMLNPKWTESMLEHGYEGVRQIETHITNTFGWSATTGQVAPWVYRKLTETYVLDKSMRDRLAALNPTASAKLANRLIEAHERNYWTPDPETLQALQDASDELEDRIEGIYEEIAV